VLGFFGSEWAAGEPRVSSLVLIGHSLPQPQIEREFMQCCLRDHGPSGQQAEAAGEAVMCPPCESGVEGGEKGEVPQTRQAGASEGEPHGALRARKSFAQ
jgi:hypothetical protein